MNTEQQQDEVSDVTPAMARIEAARIQGEILRRLAEVTQARAAACIGVDASTVSRMKSSLDDACALLAAIGLQIVDANSMVVSNADMAAYKRLAFKCLKHEIEGKL